MEMVGGRCSAARSVVYYCKAFQLAGKSCHVGYTARYTLWCVVCSGDCKMIGKYRERIHKNLITAPWHSRLLLRSVGGTQKTWPRGHTAGIKACKRAYLAGRQQQGFPLKTLITGEHSRPACSHHPMAFGGLGPSLKPVGNPVKYLLSIHQSRFKARRATISIVRSESL